MRNTPLSLTSCIRCNHRPVDRLSMRSFHLQERRCYQPRYAEQLEFSVGHVAQSVAVDRHQSGSLGGVDAPLARGDGTRVEVDAAPSAATRTAAIPLVL